MSSIIQEGLRHRENPSAASVHEPVRRDVERSELAEEIAAQRDRLRMLRASALQQLREQTRGVPRWPSGPKSVPALVDEGAWWAKMLGRDQQAA